jgi:hypothetical protein
MMSTAHRSIGHCRGERPLWIDRDLRAPPPLPRSVHPAANNHSPARGDNRASGDHRAACANAACAIDAASAHNGTCSHRAQCDEAACQKQRNKHFFHGRSPWLKSHFVNRNSTSLLDQIPRRSGRGDDGGSLRQHRSSIDKASRTSHRAANVQHFHWDRLLGAERHPILAGDFHIERYV